MGPGREREDLRPTEQRVITRMDLKGAFDAVKGCNTGRCRGNGHSRPTEIAAETRQQLEEIYREATR